MIAARVVERLHVAEKHHLKRVKVEPAWFPLAQEATQLVKSLIRLVVKPDQVGGHDLAQGVEADAEPLATSLQIPHFQQADLVVVTLRIDCVPVRKPGLKNPNQILHHHVALLGRLVDHKRRCKAHFCLLVVIELP